VPAATIQQRQCSRDAAMTMTADGAAKVTKPQLGSTSGNPIIKRNGCTSDS